MNVFRYLRILARGRAHASEHRSALLFVKWRVHFYAGPTATTYFHLLLYAVSAIHSGLAVILLNASTS
jgi:hypothetical protein